MLFRSPESLKSLVFAQCSSMFSAKFLNIWNLLWSFTQKLLFISSLLSLLLSNTFLSDFPLVLFNLSLILPITREWSLFPTGPRLTVTSGNDVLHFLFIMIWFIWFFTLPFGEVHIKAWFPYAWKLFLQSPDYRAYRNSLSFLTSLPHRPIKYSMLVLSSPTFALMSPIMIKTSCLGRDVVIPCNVW